MGPFLLLTKGKLRYTLLAMEQMVIKDKCVSCGNPIENHERNGNYCNACCTKAMRNGFKRPRKEIYDEIIKGTSEDSDSIKQIK